MTGRRPSRWKRLLVAALFAFLSLLLVATLPWFRLQSVQVDSLRTIREEEVLAASGLQDRQHLFKGLGGSLTLLRELRYGQVEKRLEDHLAKVETAHVRLVFPSTIDIRIQERVEVAYLALPDGHVVIDKHGVALWTQSERPDGIPVIQGIRALSMDLGSPLSVDVPQAMHSAIALMGAIIEADEDARSGTRLLPRVESIRPIGSRRVYMQVQLADDEEDLTVLTAAGPELAESMTWLRFALEQSVLEDRGRGVLDMTGDRITFRPD